MPSHWLPLVVHASSPRGGIIFGDIHQLDGHVDGLEAVSAYFSRGDQGGAACHLPSTTMSLDGMVQRGLGDGRGMMGRAQGRGAVCRHGSVDGKPGKVNALIPLGDGFAEDGGSDLYGVYAGAC